MKTLSTLALTILLVTTATATLDPEPDKMGLYFDETADVTAQHVTPFTPFHLYIVLTNSTHAEISGFEVGYTIVAPSGSEGLIIQFAAVFPGDLSLPICTTPTCDIELVWSEPIPTSPALTLGRLQFMMLSDFIVEIVLHASADLEFDAGVPAVLVDGEWYPTGVTCACGWNFDDCASVFVNDYCPIAADMTTWGQLKALYR